MFAVSHRSCSLFSSYFPCYLLQHGNLYVDSFCSTFRRGLVVLSPYCSIHSRGNITATLLLPFAADLDMKCTAPPSSLYNNPGSNGPPGNGTGAGTRFFSLASRSVCRLSARPLLRLRRLSAAKQGFGETYPHNPKVVADMTALHHIHEAGILHNLGKRAKEQKPYTFMVSACANVVPRVGWTELIIRRGTVSCHTSERKHAAAHYTYQFVLLRAGFPAPLVFGGRQRLAYSTPAAVCRLL